MDLSLGSSMRSYPAFGIEGNVEAGYNMLLWGKGERRNPLFGLVRPALKLTSSAVVNNYDAKIEVYPISFIAIVRGFKHINSNFDFPFFDCDIVRCRGDIKRDYTQVKMAMAYKGVTFMGNVLMAQNSYNDPNNENKAVGEFRYAALANADKDQMYFSQYMFGYDFGGKMIGVLSEYAKFEESEQTYNMDLLIYAIKSKSSTYVFGLGQMYTSEIARGFIGVFQIKTDFIPSKKIF